METYKVLKRMKYLTSVIIQKKKASTKSAYNSFFFKRNKFILKQVSSSFEKM